MLIWQINIETHMNNKEMNLKVKVTPLMVETFNYLLNNYYVLYYFSFLIISFLIERYYLNNNISILSLHPGSVFVIIKKRFKKDF